MEQVIDKKEEKYLIKIDNFEGPFDLLCYLIDKNKMDIFNIKLDEVIEQYIEYMQEMEKLDLDIASEFVVMAATLIYLKSKKLLPLLEPEEEEEEITEEELARRILEYKMYKEFSLSLKDRWQEYSNRVSKSPDNVKLPKQKIERTYNKEIIYITYYNLIKRNESMKNFNYENINKLAEYEKITVRSKAKEIIRELMKRPKFVFNKLFKNNGQDSKLEIVTSFLGLLELAKLKRINIEQKEQFGDIVIEKKNKE